LPAAPAAAHNSLTGSDPRDGARLAAAPKQVQLTFLSRLDPGTTKITVTGPEHISAQGGAPAFNGSKVVVPFRPGAAGLYIVGYEVASGDGHPVKGEVRFTLMVGATPAAAPSPTADSTPPLASPTPPAPAPSNSVVAAPAAGDGTPRWPWVAGLLLLLSAALSGGVLLLRRRRRAAPPG
jgi:hypothetical protein